MYSIYFKRTEDRGRTKESDRIKFRPTAFGAGNRPKDISVAAGRERPVKSNEKLMNVEHRTSNTEHRIMYSVYYKKDRATCRVVAEGEA